MRSSSSKSVKALANGVMISATEPYLISDGHQNPFTDGLKATTSEFNEEFGEFQHKNLQSNSNDNNMENLKLGKLLYIKLTRRNVDSISDIRDNNLGNLLKLCLQELESVSNINCNSKESMTDVCSLNNINSNKNCEKLKCCLIKMKTKYDTLQLAHKSLKSQINIIKNENQSLMNMVNKKTNENCDLNNKIQNQDEEVTQFKSMITQLKRAVELKDGNLNESCTGLKKEIQQLQNENRQYKSEVQNLKHDFDNITCIVQDIENTKTKRSSLVNELDQIHSSILHLQKNPPPPMRTMPKVEDESISSSVKKLNAQLEIESKRNAELVEIIKCMKSELEQLRESLNTKLCESKAKLQLYELENSEKSYELGKIRSEMDIMKGKDIRKSRTSLNSCLSARYTRSQADKMCQIEAVSINYTLFYYSIVLNKYKNYSLFYRILT